MALTFDSGLPKPQYTLIREAITAALADLRRPTKYLTAVVDLAAPVHFGSGDAVNLADAVKGRTPAVAVAIGSRDFESGGTDNTEWHGPVEVHVYCCTTHARGLVEGRLVTDTVALADDTKDPGLDAIGEHVFTRLAGLPLDDVYGGCLRARRYDVAYVGGDLTVVELLFQVDLQTNTNPDRAATTVVTEILATHAEAAVGDPAATDALTELDP